MNFRSSWKKALLWLGAAAVGFVLLRATVLAPPAVRLVSPGTMDLVAEVYGNGTIEAKVVVAVSSKVTGRIREVYADQGDRVKAGQPLARLEDEDFRQQALGAQAAARRSASAVGVEEAGHRKALAGLSLAEENARRAAELGKKNLAPSQEVEAQAAAREIASREVERSAAAVQALRMEELSARANAAFFRSRHDDTLIAAPQDGIVLSRDLEKGASVSAGVPIFRLADPSVVWVRANVDESKRNALAVGQDAFIEIRSSPGRRFPGRVSRIGIESDRVTEEIEVNVVFDPPLEDVRFGEQAEVHIVTARRRGVPALPASTIAVRGPGRSVWTFADGRLRKTGIVAGIEDRRGHVEVVSGLPAGTAVVAAPPEVFAGFSEGMRVRVTR